MVARFAFTVFLFLFSASAFSASPNILIIQVDDLGYGDTAVYGHPIINTPVAALDILPTIADYLELVLPEDSVVDGQSIAGLLD